MNGGKYYFGESWSRKFCKRWNLVQRKITTKMREKPADLEEKKDEFIRIAAEIFRRYEIHPDLVINCDETGVLFVPRAKWTIANKGAKRVRAIGVDSDKAQFTATIAVTESGNVLRTQLIFGGTTERCHPGGTHGRQYDELLFEHSASHWQTPQTYLRYLKEIIIPYKNNTIIKNMLPIDAPCILKHDLHYSHKDETVLNFMKANNIFALFVPAKCTDWMQECDIVVNQPFKHAIRYAFRDYLYQSFEDYISNGLNDPYEWEPNLNIGVLKPLLPQWVLLGIAAIQSTNVKDAIRTAFSEAGCIGLSRKIALQQREREMPSIEDLMGNIMLGEESDDEEPEEIDIDEFEN